MKRRISSLTCCYGSLDGETEAVGLGLYLVELDLIGKQSMILRLDPNQLTGVKFSGSYKLFVAMDTVGLSHVLDTLSTLASMTVFLILQMAALFPPVPLILLLPYILSLTYSSGLPLESPWMRSPTIIHDDSQTHLSSSDLSLEFQS